MSGVICHQTKGQYFVLIASQNRQKNRKMADFFNFCIICGFFILVHIWICLFLPVLIMTDFIFIFLYIWESTSILLFQIKQKSHSLICYCVALAFFSPFLSYIVNTCPSTVYVLLKITILAKEKINKIEQICHTFKL